MTQYDELRKLFKKLEVPFLDDLSDEISISAHWPEDETDDDKVKGSPWVSVEFKFDKDGKFLYVEVST